MADTRDTGAKVFGDVLGGQNEKDLREFFNSKAFGADIA